MWSAVVGVRAEMALADGSGLVRRRFVVRRAEDSWRRLEGGWVRGRENEGRRNGRLAMGRRGTMACMACRGGGGNVV